MATTTTADRKATEISNKLVRVMNEVNLVVEEANRSKREWAGATIESRLSQQIKDANDFLKKYWHR